MTPGDAIAARCRPPRLSVLFLAWLAGLLLAACSAAQAPLRVGSYPWPGFATLEHARVRGLLDTRRVQLLDFDSAEATIRALREDRIDAAGLTLDEVLKLVSTGERGRIVLVFDFSKGGDALLVRPPIARLEELRGRRIGVEAGAEGGYILARILDRAGLKAEDIQVVELAFDRHEQAYRIGQVDALVTMDPVRSRLLGAGAYELFSSTEIMGELLDVLFVREEALRSHPQALKALIEAHFRALDSIRDDPMGAALGLGSRFGLPGEVVNAWTQIEFAGGGANERLLGGGGLITLMEKLQEHMLHAKIIANKVVQPDLVDSRFVRIKDR